MKHSTVALPDFHDIRFESIQALRGITALFIILEHIRFLSCGAFGVDIFFCISGFMIMFSTHKSTKFFLRKRIIRIVPLYYLMTLGTFLLLLLFPGMFAQTKANPVFLLKSLLFIPFEITDGIIQPLLRIGWTVNCEIFFYVLFWLALKISHKYRGLICSLLLCILVGIAQLLSGLGFDFAPLTFYGDPVMLEFILGIITYYLAQGIYRLYQTGRLSKLTGQLCSILLPVTFLALILTKPIVNIRGFNRLPVWGLPAMLILLCTFILGLYVKKLPGALVHLGNISFSVYLMHYYPVMLLDRAVFDFSTGTPFTMLGTAVAIAVSVVLAMLCYEVMEKRFTEFLKKRLL